MTSSQETIAEVTALDQQRDSVRITLRIVSLGFRDRLDPPLIPASLVSLHEPELEGFQLHQLQRQSDDQLVYSSFETTSHLPIIGERYILRFWWDQSQLDAVLDRDALWVRQPYPFNDPGTHDHCLLTWVTIAADSDHTEGYRSHHGWLSVEAYDCYIARDILRLRH